MLTSEWRVRGGRGTANGAILLVVLSTGNVFATSVSSSVDDIDVGFLPRRYKNENRQIEILLCLFRELTHSLLWNEEKMPRSSINA